MVTQEQLRGIAPSILAADFARLGEQVAEVMAAGAKIIHVDVMDGHFVPPISMGPLVVSAIADQVHQHGGIIDVHLMIERPEHHISEFAKAGADAISLHVEATPHINYALHAVKEHGCAAGIAICPGTPVMAVVEVLGSVDLVLCMSVNPGWGGQPFIPQSVDKVQRLHALAGPGVSLEVDGGINSSTAAACAQAGATTFVAGSSIFGASDPAEAYRGIAAAVGA